MGDIGSHTNNIRLVLIYKKFYRLFFKYHIYDFNTCLGHRNTEGGRARIHEMQDLNFAMPAAPSGKTLLVPSWQEQTTKTMTNALTFEYDTDYNMQISGGLGYMESVYKGSFTQLLMKNRAKGGNLGNYTAQAAQPFEFLSRTTSGNLKARGEFETGPVVHNWATSFDYIKRHRDHDQGTRNGDGPAVRRVFSRRSSGHGSGPRR